MDAIKLCKEVCEEEALELLDGQKVRSVAELLIAIKNMDKETFGYHISKSHNDFAEWIYENYGNERVFLEVSRIKNKEKLEKYLEKVLKKEIKEFSKKAKSAEKEKTNKIIPPKNKKDALNGIKNAW